MTERDIFLAAIDLPDPAARQAYLDMACGRDTPMRWRVEALLRSHEEAGSFLGKPVVAPPDPNQHPTMTVAPSPDGSSDREVLDESFPFLAPAQRPDSLGRLGHYEMLQVLGQGGFGIVFRAFDEMLQRVVAVKVMAPQLAATSPARKRFLREARSSAAIRHENVVQVHEVAEDPLPYLVMEFIPGETLQQRVEGTGPLDPAEVVRIGRQVAEGLAAAHATDLIHRDIKPANVLIEGGPQHRVKITDFGLARAADDASISQSGIIAGTPMYMAPEQALGHTLDQRADLFSLGSVLYQMTSGRPPFRANGTLAVLKRVAEDTPRPIREIIPEAPKWLCDIIAKLHAKNPDDRFQSAREVADVLADCEAQLKAHGTIRDFGRIPGGGKSPRRYLKEPLAVVLVVVLALLGPSLLRGIPFLLRYVQDEGRIDVSHSNGFVSVIVHQGDHAITDWFAVDKGPIIDLPPGKYKLEPGFAPGKTVLRWEVTVFGFSSHRTTVQSTRACEVEVARGERVLVHAVMRDDPTTLPVPTAPVVNGFEQLLNGKDLAWWTPYLRGDGTWRVSDDGSLSATGTGYLFSWRNFENFHLRAEVRIDTGGGDSGLLFRCDRNTLTNFPPVGFRAVINPADRQNPRTGWLIDPTSNVHQSRDPVVPEAGTWFTYEVIAAGNMITLKVNGQTTLAGEYGNSKWATGPIGLQLPGKGKTITFRRIEIQPLPANPPMNPVPPARNVQSPQKIQALREAIEAKERTASRMALRVREGVARPEEAHIAESEVLEARVRLAEAEGDTQGVIDHMTKALALCQEVRRLVAIRVEAGIEPVSELEPIDDAIARCTARLARERAKLPKPAPAAAPFDADKATEHQEAWARYLGVPVEYANSLGTKFRLIPAGEFLMGNADENPFAQAEDRPRHRVTLTEPFYLATHETTRGEFAPFLADTKRKTFAEDDPRGAFAVVRDGYARRPGLNWRAPGFPQEDSHPVTCVTWEEANAYCEWLSKKDGLTYRLPTDAQWEFACRGGTATAYHYGATADPMRAAVGRRAETLKTLPVGSFPANPFGLRDMIGNVYEWCHDGRRKYTPDAVTDPVGETGPKTDRVRRGGAWSSALDQKTGAKPGARSVAPPEGDAAQMVGFRVAIVGDLKPKPAPVVTPLPKKDGE